MTSKHIMSYLYDQSGAEKDEEDIPTSICLHNGQLVSGYVNSHFLVHFDL